MKFIYQPGQLHAQTSTYTKDGIEYVEYTSPCFEFPTPPTISEYLAILNKSREPDSSEFIICDLEELKIFTSKIEAEKFIKPWVEITSNEWYEALNCLPPEKWLTVKGVNIFRMSEYYTGNITTHYARLGEKYFKAMRLSTHKYEDLAREVYEAAAK
jgi:hypothetical protein